jgi:two-component system LytT family response regulator
MKAVIIDDAEKARIALRSDLKTYCPGVEVIGEGEGVVTGLDLILRLKPALVFLDIRMSDGTGFDLLEQIKAQKTGNFKVIFTTAYNEYAIKAFKFSAIDYLLKPIDAEELKQAVDRITDQERTSVPSPDRLDFLLDSFKDIQASTKKIALASTDKIQIVSLADIIRCESQRNYTLFLLTGNRSILVTKTLKDYDDMLEEYGFLRVHHSHLINLKHMKEFVKTEGGFVLMSDASQVPVSVRKKEQLLKLLGLMS